MGLALLCLVAGLQPARLDAQTAAPDLSMGPADAKVTIIEYASMTCPHCADFHENIMPKVKAEYVDTGKIRFIFREFPLDELALRGAMIARCAGPERSLAFIDVMFRQQRTWATAADPIASLAQIARLGGMSDGDVAACLANRQVEEQILATRLTANRDLGVNSTPTLFINNQKVTTPRSFEEFKPLIEAALSGGGSAGAAPAPVAPISAPASGVMSGDMTKWLMSGAIAVLAIIVAFVFMRRR